MFQHFLVSGVMGTKKDVPLFCYAHKRHANALTPRKDKGTSAQKNADAPCKRMVSMNFWRFLMYPSLEDIVIYLLCFYKKVTKLFSVLQ